jgi:hypothetical protein
MTLLGTYVCTCGAKCSSLGNLISHVRSQALGASTKYEKDRHIVFAAALPVLYPSYGDASVA